MGPEIPLEELFGVPSGTRYVYLYCPAHGDKGRPNLAVYRDGTYCFACGFKESPEAFLARIAQDPQALAGARAGGNGGGLRGPSLEELQAWVREAQANLWEGAMRERQGWLRERGLSLTYARAYGLGHTGVAFLIPYWGPYGELTGAKLRADPQAGLDWRYRNLPGSSGQLFRPNPGGRPLVVVEGELDALLLAQYGADALTVSSGAGGLKRIPELVRLPESGVLIATDWDPAGEEAARALLAQRPGWARLPRPDPGVKDVSEWLSALPRGDRGCALRNWALRTRCSS